LTVLEKLKSVYKLWQRYLKDFPKTNRYTLGEKIDALLIAAIEMIVRAQYANRSEERVTLVVDAMTRLDLSKFFLELAWEAKALNDEKYAAISEGLHEIGRMLGGWKKTVEQKLPRETREKS
jgi:hypothetical protein